VASGGLIAVLGLFCVPLFVGLRGWDLRNDEAIYSYAVDRILETGDWLTPRLIPRDGPFFEKPPLKFWIVAAAIRSGLLPHDEFGLRFFDAVFGAVSFVYVFLLGRLLAGPLCGVIAVLVLFTIDPLLFFHGIRENNMDAAVVLAYCGGMYHFARSLDTGPAARAARDRLAVGAYVTLGFLTKFVAVLFLPVVCALALTWRAGALSRIREEWRRWIPAAVFVLATTSPWFLYQTLRSGSVLWQTMIEQHVYVRFTDALDPTHLQPWHYYYTEVWRELTVAGSLGLSAIGLLFLARSAWTGQPWLARLVLLWWVVPFALLSIGTSKLIHYAYPFLPPIALGAGLAADALVRVIYSAVAAILTATVGRLVPRQPRSTAGALLHHLLAAVGVCALVVAAVTASTGRLRWEFDGVQLLQNSSVVRPLLIAGVLLCVTGYGRVVSAIAALSAVAVLLPVRAYPHTLERITSVARPLHTLRDCVLAVDVPQRETHVYPPYAQISNSYYYYLRGIGRWVEHAGRPKNDELQRRLFASGEQALMIVLRQDYDQFTQQLDRESRPPAGLSLSESNAEVLLTPGPFEICGDTSGSVSLRPSA
jgi:4-amino-4-deoxy-L-arabinose transferase-like glycosyltransferase